LADEVGFDGLLDLPWLEDFCAELGMVASGLFAGRMFTMDESMRMSLLSKSDDHQLDDE
jgi:hypothetical protein